jgi:hypothetical protein
LKTIKKEKFEETVVEKALMDRGTTFIGLLISEKLSRLNNTMKANEESTNGEFDVDFSKFFKRQATNLDVTIFEGSPTLGKGPLPGDVERISQISTLDGFHILL